MTTTRTYPLSLHDALPICPPRRRGGGCGSTPAQTIRRATTPASVTPSGSRATSTTVPVDPSCSSTPPRSTDGDRKSTRLNSSHGYISYAVFCLKKKNNRIQTLHDHADNHLVVELLALVLHEVDAVRDHHDAVAAGDPGERD